MQNISLQIDNHTVEVEKGTTLLEAARQIGIHIPSLCYMNLKDLCISNLPASCRICVVEVEGHPLRGRHESTHQQPARAQRPPHGARTHPFRPPQRLPHLPEVRELRTASPGKHLENTGNPLRRRTQRPPHRDFPLHHPRHEQVHLLPPLRNDVQRSADRRRAGSRQPGLCLHHLPRLP